MGDGVSHDRNAVRGRHYFSSRIVWFRRYAIRSNRHGLAIRLIAIQQSDSDFVRVDMPSEIGQMHHQLSSKSPEGRGVECSDGDLNPGHCLERAI